MSAEDDLVAELVRVRRGWGLQDRDLTRRIGPLLARCCGVRPSDNDRVVHDRVRAWLTARAAELPPELARAVLVAFALDRDRLYRQLSQRVEHLAAEQLCAPRTVRRRIDHAVRLIAHASVRDAAQDTGAHTGQERPDAWRLRELRTVLRLDTVPPELHESREIVATGQDHGTALPVLHESRIAAHPSAPAHFALLPLVPCDHITVEVRFGPHRPPGTVWRLDAVPAASLDEVEPAHWRALEPLPPDGSGQFRLTFDEPRQRHGYGVLWMPA